MKSTGEGARSKRFYDTGRRRRDITALSAYRALRIFFAPLLIMFHLPSCSRGSLLMNYPWMYARARSLAASPTLSS